MTKTYRIDPPTAQRWTDFQRLFGPRGACGGCWCMFWKLPSKDFDTLLHEGNRKAQRAIVRSGATPGLLAYSGHEPVGWIAVGPRCSYPRLARSRVLKPVDDEPVWSITCFFVDRCYRRRGITVSLLRAAICYVKGEGGRILEGYPLDSSGGKLPAVSAYMGLVSAFRKAGFKEVARYSARRLIYRYRIGG